MWRAGHQLASRRSRDLLVRGAHQYVRSFATAPFTLPDLPYGKTELEPHISKETLDYHHGKHHQTYVTKLNGLAKDNADLQGKTLEDIIKSSSGGVFNNAAQIWNHTFYWNCLAPNGGGAPTGAIADKINSQWGSFEKFQDDFTNQCVNHFGSGWVWLVQKGTGELEISQTHDAGCPVTDTSVVPILTCDVWEHAYYVDYRNVRPEYMKAFWNVINWEFANANLK